MICILNENNPEHLPKKGLCGKKIKQGSHFFDNVSHAYECATSKYVKICPDCKRIVIDKFKKAK